MAGRRRDFDLTLQRVVGVVMSNDKKPTTEARRATIMVVEDMALVANEIDRQLKMAGYRVLGPYDSVDNAMAAVEGEAFDAALLDVNLAGAPCYPIADLLRSKGIPFCFLTGYLKDYLPEEYAELPYLEKPFGREELRAAIERLLHQAPHANP